jgi:hypothetical protein
MTKALVPSPAHSIAYSLLAIAFFVPQPFFLPIFPYAFLALGAVWIVLVRRLSQLSLFIGLCVLVATIYPILVSERSASYQYFLTSLALVPISTAIVRNLPRALMAATRLYLMFSLLAVLLGVIVYVAGAQTGIVIEDANGTIRARGLNDEPNFMGFSLVVIYILVLFHDSRLAKALIVTVIWFLAFASFSIYAIISLLVVSLIYIFYSRKFTLLVWIFVPLSAAALINFDRINSIVQGVDNSANLRTWGALFVAYESVKECGLTGCGVGSARSTLLGNPLMESFSAHDVLPNLGASALLEVGPVGVTVIFGLIFTTAFGNPLRRNRNRGLSLAAFYCLTSYALSGSYLYDPHFWVTVGLFGAVCRSWAPVNKAQTKNGSSLRKAPLNDKPLPG